MNHAPVYNVQHAPFALHPIPVAPVVGNYHVEEPVSSVYQEPVAMHHVEPVIHPDDVDEYVEMEDALSTEPQRHDDSPRNSRFLGNWDIDVDIDDAKIKKTTNIHSNIDAELPNKLPKIRETIKSGMSTLFPVLRQDIHSRLLAALPQLTRHIHSGLSVLLPQSTQLHPNMLSGMSAIAPLSPQLLRQIQSGLSAVLPQLTQDIHSGLYADNADEERTGRQDLILNILTLFDASPSNNDVNVEVPVNVAVPIDTNTTVELVELTSL